MSAILRGNTSSGNCRRCRACDNRMILGIVAILTLFTLIAPAAHAKLPELDAVYYGDVFHNTNQDLIPTFTGEIIVSAELNGVQIASVAVPFGDNAFVLKVPLDDGHVPRLPGTARFGEPIRVFIENTVEQLKFQVNETEITPLSISPVKGDIQNQAFRVDEDLDGSEAPEMDGYAIWKPGFLESGNGFNPLDPFSNDALRDNDLDGLTNLEEFLADTDPLSPHSRFEILQVVRGAGVNSIKFGPIRLSRRYYIYAGGAPGGPPWLEVGSYAPAADSDFAWFDHLSEVSALIYKVSVELE